MLVQFNVTLLYKLSNAMSVELGFQAYDCFCRFSIFANSGFTVCHLINFVNIAIDSVMILLLVMSVAFVGMCVL